MSNRRYICSDHDEISELAEEIISIISDNKDDVKYKVRRQIVSKLKRIVKVAAQAKDSGQAMENRLYEYHEAITGIGFERRK